MRDSEDNRSCRAYLDTDEELFETIQKAKEKMTTAPDKVTEEDLCEFAKFGDESLRLSIVLFEVVTDRTLDILAHVFLCEWRVKCRIARCETTGLQTLRYLAADPDGRVRRALALSTNPLVSKTFDLFEDEPCADILKIICKRSDVPPILLGRLLLQRSLLKS